MEREGEDQVQKFYCKQCCQIFSDKTICPQCRLPVEAEIYIQVHYHQGKKGHQ